MQTVAKKIAHCFGEALDKAQEALKGGHILRYDIVRDPIKGRIIKMETANGWSPYPLFVEFPRA